MKFRNWKRGVKPLIIGCACGGLVFGIGSTMSYSYLQSRSDVVNRFTADSVETTVTEEFPGGGVKKVRATNTGDVPCYVRVMLLPSALTSSEGDISLNLSAYVDDSLTGGKPWYHKSGEDTYGTYYYYKRILQPGESTDYLFTSYSISGALNGATAVETASPGDAAELKLTVYQESTQSEGFTDAVKAFSETSNLLPAQTKPVD